MFGTAFDYYEVNAGIHRNSTRILTAPAVVRYLAFWTNAGQRDIEGSEEGAAKIKDKLDNFILTLCRVLEEKVGAVNLAPCISGVHLLFNNICHEGFSPAKIDLLSKRQMDIFTSTSRVVSLQFTWKKLVVTIRFEIHTEYFSLSTFVEFDKGNTPNPYSDLDSLNCNIDAMLGYFNRDDRSSGFFDQNLPEQLNTYFFYDFWEAYESEILSHASLRDLTKEGAFKRVFADFRGLVLSDQVINFFDDTDFSSGDRSPSWGQNAKSKFLPLIQPRARYECAANYMLDGHAFYMSTLGPQLPPTTLDERSPGEFIIYASQRLNSSKTFVNKWQLGRLVNQILLLDTLRLCALKDVKYLHGAAQQLARLDRSTQIAGDATLVFNDKAMELITETHENLNRITGIFLEQTASGLLHRIERSRYYVGQFNDGIRHLRIRRLEGDQPYDEFIKRRLGAEFDFIDRLGLRYARATNDMVALGQKVALIQSQLAITQNKIQSSIYAIQEWGEFALLAALVPYYIVHLLEKIVPEKYIAGITIVLWSGSAAFAFWRKTKKIRYSIFLLVVGTMLFFMHTFLSQHFLLEKLEKNLKGPNKSSDDQRNHSGELPDTSVNSLGAKKDSAAPPTAAPLSAE